jgi:hypothetical protein
MFPALISVIALRIIGLERMALPYSPHLIHQSLSSFKAFLSTSIEFSPALTNST